MRRFWYFMIYSFCGCLLEAAFARLTGSPRWDRKCFVLLPLCPVYGLGACLILLAAPPARGPLWVMAAGGLAATAAELAMGLFYRYALGVQFWDYTGMRGNIGGLICPMFSLCWSVLALALVYLVHPAVAPLAERIPNALAAPALILLMSDALVSCVALRRTGTTEVLRWYVPG